MDTIEYNMKVKPVTAEENPFINEKYSIRDKFQWFKQ